ncbi:MAG: PA2928 family protein [Chitinophagaceae bacterium]
MLLRKPAITIILGIAVLVLGFIFLLKGCLAKYDERFIKVPALYFEKNGKAVVFSIVEFQKTTSYSRKGNMTQKSVSTSYYVQTNDGATTAFIANKKIKGHRQVKNFPIEMLGASGITAWLFMGEPMAFDAFTLEKKADIAILETANGQLQGKFPAERQFYHFNRADNNVYFTATDGSKWKLDTRTLKATPSAYQKK